MPRVGEHVRLVDRQDSSLDLVCETSEVVKPLRYVADLTSHLRVELAVILHLDSGKMIRIARDQIAQPAQEMTSLRRMHVGPGSALERIPGGSDRDIDVTPVASRNLRPGSSQKRIDGLEMLSGFGLAPTTADVAVVGLHAFRSSHRMYIRVRRLLAANAAR